MGTSFSGFRSDLAVTSTVGIARGVSLPYQRLESNAEAEMRYRQQRLLEEATRWQNRRQSRKQERAASKKK
ncbi:hypothetical protein [Kineosporia succinea]|uniref:Uncharacterized protein n=1 Tax=Kineosporia succinea TaxID=84632 RepID=A0ABT9NW21_9ACTN|nr:hypothetical protein [Kineosporia succinea]MDP9824617.1 hypothetical protein [Kineosporia succinea]